MSDALCAGPAAQLGLARARPQTAVRQQQYVTVHCQRWLDHDTAVCNTTEARGQQHRKEVGEMTWIDN
jgi:hypothetical protein